MLAEIKATEIDCDAVEDVINVNAVWHEQGRQMVSLLYSEERHCLCSRQPIK